ncbi:hypothetical protein NQ315_013993, partial [Exocentrus adspersus]
MALNMSGAGITWGMTLNRSIALKFVALTSRSFFDNKRVTLINLVVVAENQRQRRRGHLHRWGPVHRRLLPLDSTTNLDLLDWRNLTQVLQVEHPIPTSGKFFCKCLNKVVQVSNEVAHRRTLEHRTNACVNLMPGIQLTESVFRGCIASYRVHSDNEHTDFTLFFKFVNLMVEVLRFHTTVKVNVELFGRYIIQTGESQEDLIDIKCFNTTNQIINSSMDLDEVLNMFMDILVNQASEFQERDSGWAFECIMYLEVNVTKHATLGGSSYIIKLPKFIEDKKAVINISNQDQYCFLWSIISALYLLNSRRVNEVSPYPHYCTVFDTT